MTRRAIFCTPNVTREACGFGTCDESGSNCICDPGYIHDTVTFIFRNCFLTMEIKLGLFVCIGVISLVILLFSMYQLKFAKQKARVLVKMCFAINVGWLSYLVALWVEGIQSWGTLVMYTLTLCLCMELTVRLTNVFVAPLSMFAKVNTRIIQGAMIVYRVVILSTLLVFGIGSILAYQLNDDEKLFNDLFIGHYLAIAFAELESCAAYYIAIQQILTAIQTNQTMETERFRSKSVIIRRNLMILILPSSVLLIVVFALHLVYGIHPYHYLIWFFFMSSIPVFSGVVLFFTRSSQEQYKKQRTISNIPRTDSSSLKVMDEFQNPTAPNMRSPSPRPV